jgi:hypothetical protein
MLAAAGCQRRTLPRLSWMGGPACLKSPGQRLGTARHCWSERAHRAARGVRGPWTPQLGGPAQPWQRAAQHSPPAGDPDVARAPRHGRRWRRRARSWACQSGLAGPQHKRWQPRAALPRCRGGGGTPSLPLASAVLRRPQPAGPRGAAAARGAGRTGCAATVCPRRWWLQCIGARASDAVPPRAAVPGPPGDATGHCARAPTRLAGLAMALPLGSIPPAAASPRCHPVALTTSLSHNRGWESPASLPSPPIPAHLSPPHAHLPCHLPTSHH